MKFFVFMLLVLVAFIACVPIGTNLNLQVSGSVQNNSQYCGGAAPPEFLLDSLAVYHTTANEKFYVRHGLTAAPFTTVNKTFTTDASGKYSLQVPAGDYTLISEEKYLTESIAGIDSSCSYLHSADFTISVSSTNLNFTNSFTKTCNYDCTGQIPQ